MSDEYRFRIDHGEIRKGIQELRDGVDRYRKYITIFKVIGFFSMVVALILERWIGAFLLFVLFFPEPDEIAKFFKEYYYRAIIIISDSALPEGFGSFKDRDSEQDNTKQHHH